MRLPAIFCHVTLSFRKPASSIEYVDRRLMMLPCLYSILVADDVHRETSTNSA